MSEILRMARSSSFTVSFYGKGSEREKLKATECLVPIKLT